MIAPIALFMQCIAGLKLQQWQREELERTSKPVPGQSSKSNAAKAIVVVRRILKP